jgi:ribonuclease J
LNLVRPAWFLPVHGEYRHLVQHARLAEKVGIPRERCIIMTNGDVVAFAAGEACVIDKVEHGRVFVDGKGIGDVGEIVLKDRKHLSEDGMVVVIIGIDQETGRIIYGPDIVSRGVVFEDDSREFLEQARRVVMDCLEQLSIEALGEWTEVKQEVRTVLKRFFKKTIERRPVILPVIMEM